MGYPIGGGYGLAITLVFLVGLVDWLPGSVVSGQEVEKKAFMVTDYRYESLNGATGNLDIGLSLCGTRCNSLSEDFASYLKPGGWRMVKVSGDIEVRVELNNPFLTGQCICVGDEYIINWYDPATYVDRPEAQPSPGK